ncbi:uncharacterized protein LOC127410684 isoform X2 [Myxocyprinus asiaticus]|uniref:uncharacterized protein LOC127410684 isoform X2 n=1 Tax=Myxocyprinus asiaticus TaxID=70543 RepID=UPI00222167CE|nr:uncharacterized protein LOC127410684 isoform X2 [Myxocyprinus asiaticus]
MRSDLFFVLLSENAALWGTSSQSSNYVDLYSTYAIDGDPTTRSETATETNPWWRVDLLNVYRVNRVAITNRASYYFFRIDGSVLRVGNFLDMYSNPICAAISTIPSGVTANFSCGGMEGRYVYIHIPGNQKILALCEVGVYGYLLDNLAIGGTVKQSSTYFSWFAGQAIDGNRGFNTQANTACSSTNIESSPWWSVDLNHVYQVNTVVISNIICCPERIIGAEIRIGNSLENDGNNNPICAVIPSIPAGNSSKFSCGGMEGRYVNLIIPGNMKQLTLCEVEVYGEGPLYKKIFVKMQFNSKADLTNPIMTDNILKQLESVLANRGYSNVTISWSQTPKQVPKVETAKAPCRKFN